MLIFFKEKIRFINYILTDRKYTFLTMMFTQLRTHKLRQILDPYEMTHIVVSRILQMHLVNSHVSSFCRQWVISGERLVFSVPRYHIH